MCSNPCESEVTCFVPESNRGPYGLLISWVPRSPPLSYGDGWITENPLGPSQIKNPLGPSQMIIWIFLAPHLPQCTHHAILPISRRNGEPDTAQCALTDDAPPSLLAILWRTFSPCICISVCENAPWSRAANTRRDAPYKDMPTQWGMAPQEEMATQDETAE